MTTTDLIKKLNFLLRPSKIVQDFQGSNFRLVRYCRDGIYVTLTLNYNDTCKVDIHKHGILPKHLFQSKQFSSYQEMLREQFNYVLQTNSN